MEPAQALFTLKEVALELRGSKAPVSNLIQVSERRVGLSTLCSETRLHLRSELARKTSRPGVVAPTMQRLRSGTAEIGLPIVCSRIVAHRTVRGYRLAGLGGR